MLKKMSAFVIVAILGPVFLGVSGVGNAAGLPKEIKIGCVIPLTGGVAAIGNSCQRGLEMAVNYINQGGFLKDGAKIKVIWGDDEAKPEVSMSEVERMIHKENVDLLIGSFTSACSFPITQVAEKNKIPIIVPGSGKDEITERGFKYTFRVCTKSGWIGREHMEFISWLTKKTNTPVKNIAILSEDSGWGQSVIRSVEKEAPSAGYKIIDTLTYSASETKDFRSTIMKLKAANPDLVIQVSYAADAILITKTMHAVQFSNKGIIATGTGHTTQEYHDGVGKLSEYLMAWDAWSPAIPIEEVKVRSKEFKEKYGKIMDQFVALFYTAGYTAARAFNQAGTVDKNAVRDALSTSKLKRGEKGNLLIFDVDFDEQGQNKAPMGVYTQVFGGKMELIYPEFAAAKSVVFPVPPWSQR
jgi:branched-chain amino acid transport system substrate-binding protein